MTIQRGNEEDLWVTGQFCIFTEVVVMPVITWYGTINTPYTNANFLVFTLYCSEDVTWGKLDKECRNLSVIFCNFSWIMSKLKVYISRGWQIVASGPNQRLHDLVNKVVMVHRQAHLFVYKISTVVFVLQQQSWIVLTETLWPAKPKIILSGLYRSRLPMSEWECSN